MLRVRHVVWLMVGGGVFCAILLVPRFFHRWELCRAPVGSIGEVVFFYDPFYDPVSSVDAEIRWEGRHTMIEAVTLIDPEGGEPWKVQLSRSKSGALLGIGLADANAVLLIVDAQTGALLWRARVGDETVSKQFVDEFELDQEIEGKVLGLDSVQADNAASR